MDTSNLTPSANTYNERLQFYLNQLGANSNTQNSSSQGKGPNIGVALAAPVGTVGAMYGGKKLAQYLFDKGVQNTSDIAAKTASENIAWNANADAATYGTPQLTSNVAQDVKLSTPELVSANRVPVDNFDLTKALQGAAGFYGLYRGYQDFKDGNKLGAGINTIGGGTNLASALGNDTASSVLGYVNPALGAYQGYQTIKGWDAPKGGARNSSSAMSGAAAGAALGSVIPGVGTAVGALIGAGLGLGGSIFGSSKDKYQLMRDQVRKSLVKQGVLRQDDTGHQFGTLADGSEFDFSKDGKKYGKPQFENPLYSKAAAYGNVLASAEGLSGKAREALATLYANAGVSNAGSSQDTLLKNFQHFAAQRGLTQDLIQKQIDALKPNLTQDEYSIFSNDKKYLVPEGLSTPGFITKPLITNLPARSKTISPGISKDGKKISYGGK